MPRRKAKQHKPVSVYIPLALVPDFEALVAEARTQFPTMSESGFIVAVLFEKAEQKKAKRKR